MTVEIRVAATQVEREAVYRLRYKVYVEEMQIFGSKADHGRMMFEDEHDASARLIYAMDDGEMVGTLRLNMGVDAAFSAEFAQTYQLGRFRSAVGDDKIAILTRFMVKSAVRGTPLPFQLIREAAALTTKEGVELAFCDCQPHLIHLYRRLGFRSYDCPVYNDPEFGIMIPLAFVHGDLDYLQRIRSPLRHMLSRTVADKATASRVAALLGQAAVQDTDRREEEAWSEIYALLESRADNGTRLFQNLEEDEVQSIVSRGHVIQCSPGDRVIRQGQSARTVFVVLSGSLEVREGKHVIAVKTAGNVVGELAFLLDTRRTVDVYSGPDGAKILSLDESTLRQLIERPSRVAAVLLLNLSKVLALKLAETTATIRASLPVVYEDT